MFQDRATPFHREKRWIHFAFSSREIMKHRVLAIILFFLALPALADFQEGIEAFNQGDYQKALEAWRPLLEAGDPRAQNNLGSMYDYGLGVPQDYIEAEHWYRLAAEQGNATAQNNLGSLFDYGLGVTQDFNEAAKWYRRAADQGSVAAQHNLGILYANGTGVFQDYIEAVRWYGQAAEQGYAPAQGKLGGMYGLGYGVTQDYVDAYMWLELATMQSDEEARQVRDIFAAVMTPAQIFDAQALARDWLAAQP